MKVFKYQTHVLKDCIMRSGMICTAHTVLFWRSNRRLRWAGHVASTEEEVNRDINI